MAQFPNLDMDILSKLGQGQARLLKNVYIFKESYPKK